MPPPWLFAIAILGVLALGVMAMGRKFIDAADMRARTARQQAAIAAAQQAEADLQKGITSALDPIGILF